MIGHKIRVFWPVDERWYTGTVHEYDQTTGEHLLRYSDGDSEWVRIGENNSAGASAAAVSSGSEHGSSPPRGGQGAPSGVGASPTREKQSWPQTYPNQGHPGQQPQGHMMPMQYYGPQYGFVAPGPPGYPPPQGVYYMYPPRSQGSPEGDSRRKTGPKAWTKEEDRILLSIVQSMQMPMKWSIVAQNLPDRTGKQCRERYVNHLNPRLKLTDWTPVEDATIFHLYNTMGSHWAKMSKVIPGRTDNGIKNRFHNLRRQYEREDENRTRFSNLNEFESELRIDRHRKIPEQLKGKTSKLWDMETGLGILAAQTVLGTTPSNNRANNMFGPFVEAKESVMCVRCGFFIPSVQTGTLVCAKSGWCKPCARITPSLSGGMLRECLDLRREKENKEYRKIIESWDEITKAEPTSSEEAVVKAEDDKPSENQAE